MNKKKDWSSLYIDYINPINIDCPYKQRSIIIAILLTIPFYGYMQAMYMDCNKREQKKCHKDRLNPTIPNAYHMARSGWK